MPHWQWLWAAEIEKFPAAVHAARHGSPNLGDVTANDFIARAEAAGKTDCIVFGSPCQSFSIAGKRLGMDDPRGNLALIALGIIARLRPTWIVFENVPGLLSSSSGRDFGAFLRAVEQCRYFGAWTILDAQHFGVPQRRRRVFFVGHLGDWRGPAAVLFEPESLRGDHPPRREAREGVARTIGAGIGRRSAQEDAANGHMIVSTGETAHCLNAGAMGRLDYESETLIAFPHQLGGTMNMPIGNDMALPLIKSQGQAVAYDMRGRDGGAQFEGPHDTANIRASSGGSSRSYVATHAVRRLTPRECERLQGFPDDFTAITYRNKPAADGPRYKALGNSMAVPVIRWILQRIEAFEAMKAAA